MKIARAGRHAFLEAIGKDLLAAAGATTVDEHGDRLAPLHVREFAVVASAI